MKRSVSSAPLYAKIRMHELEKLAIPLHIKVLSFDFFDTLVWRKYAHPFDVFVAAGHQNGWSAHQRVRAEHNARLRGLALRQSTEVTLREIVAEGFPNRDEEFLDQYADNEVFAELCALEPTPMFHWMQEQRAGHFAGRVAIVSDTYLEQGDLMRAGAPNDCPIFCSGHARISKVDGLLHLVPRAFQVRHHEVLHIGDNPHADFAAARAAGMSAVLVVSQSRASATILRQTTNAACVLDPEIRSKRPMPAPAARPFALDPNKETLAKRIGFYGLGPILHAVTECLRGDGHPLFALRDAYLLAEAFGAGPDHRVRLSRFASIAASLTSEEGIRRFLGSPFAVGVPAKTVLRQLLLPPGALREIVNKHGHVDVARVLRYKVRRRIQAAARAQREGLLAHLQNALRGRGFATLVDLGYEGTTQRYLTPILEEHGIQLRGHYLLFLDAPDPVKAESVLRADYRALHLLATNIAPLELLCREPLPTVERYSKTGEAISGGRAPRQPAIIREIQAEAVRYVRLAKSCGLADEAALRDYALGALGRLLLTPTEEELQLFRKFSLDLNLGSSSKRRLIDTDRFLEDARHVGPFPSNADRMCCTTEASSASQSLGLAHIAMRRFGINLQQGDLVQRSRPIGLAITPRGKKGLVSVTLPAHATYDGYWALEVICAFPEGSKIVARLPDARDLELFSVKIDGLYHNEQRAELPARSWSYRAPWLTVKRSPTPSHLVRILFRGDQ